MLGVIYLVNVYSVPHQDHAWLNPDYELLPNAQKEQYKDGWDWCLLNVGIAYLSTLQSMTKQSNLQTQKRTKNQERQRNTQRKAQGAQVVHLADDEDAEQCDEDGWSGESGCGALVLVCFSGGLRAPS